MKKMRRQDDVGRRQGKEKLFPAKHGNEHPTLPPLADCDEPIVAKANNVCSHNRK